MLKMRTCFGNGMVAVDSCVSRLSAVVGVSTASAVKDCFLPFFPRLVLLVCGWLDPTDIDFFL